MFDLKKLSHNAFSVCDSHNKNEEVYHSRPFNECMDWIHKQDEPNRYYVRPNIGENGMHPVVVEELKAREVEATNSKPTPIDLVEYVVHKRDCDSRNYWMKGNEIHSQGECNCGLHDLLLSLGLRNKITSNMY